MTQECPLSQCDRWLKSKTTFSPHTLEDISLNYIIYLVKIYPESTKKVKESLHRSLKNLLYLPAKYTSRFTQEILRSTWSRAAIINNQPVDLFLVNQLQSELVKWLDFDRMGPNYRVHTILNLNRMPSLLKLNLRLAGPKPWSETFNPTQSFNILSTLSILRDLTFQNLADDLFVSYIGSFCKQLFHLDLLGSVNVTKKSLESLDNLSRLVSLDLSGTSVEEDDLLVFFAKQNKFVNVGAFSNLTTLDTKSLNNLKQVYIKNPNQLDINSVVENCPKIERLELRCMAGSCKLHRLGSLLGLSSMFISGINYRSGNVSVCLLGRAASLTRLHLEHVTGMDSCDLRTIGQYLTSLEDLTLMNCCLSRGLMDRVEEHTAEKKQLRLFTSLKVLNISSNISPSQFLLLTGHATELTCLQTGLSCWLSTRLLSHLVRLNGLTQLQYLRIDHTSDLCTAALFLLLRTARSLTTIVGADTWQDLDPRLCKELNSLFLRHHLPHTLVSFQSQIF